MVTGLPSGSTWKQTSLVPLDLSLHPQVVGNGVEQLCVAGVSVCQATSDRGAPVRWHVHKAAANRACPCCSDVTCSAVDVTFLQDRKSLVCYCVDGRAVGTLRLFWRLISHTRRGKLRETVIWFEVGPKAQHGAVEGWKKASAGAQSKSMPTMHAQKPEVVHRAALQQQSHAPKMH